MDYLTSVVSLYRKKGLLTDTNLLLLYFVGANDPNRIGQFKRTMKFTIDEFKLLQRFFTIFERVVTTPNVLTEVSNLLGQLPKNLHASFYGDFAQRVNRFDEFYSPTVNVAQTAHFNSFGLTDSGIVETVRGQYLVLTDDLELFGYLQNLQIDAINFNHLRYLAWG